MERYELNAFKADLLDFIKDWTDHQTSMSQYIQRHALIKALHKESNRHCARCKERYPCATLRILKGDLDAS